MKKITTICTFGLMAAALITGCAKKAVTEESVNEDVKLGKYIGVEFSPLKVEVTDEHIETEIQKLLDENPTFIEVDRPAQAGDTVNIDYVGLKEGVAFDGGTAAGFDLVLGSGSFIPGFEDGLIGATKGQELSLDITFPEDYGNQELAGQAVVFEVTVNAIKESSIEVDRPAQEGDIANIDYVGLKDGVAFEGGTDDGFDLALGSGTFIPGFEEGLIGVTKGQELSLDITFPENYGNQELAGQPVVFDVTVNSIREPMKSEFNDEFAAANTEYKTVEEYREATKTRLLEAAEMQAENQKISDVFGAVMEASEVKDNEDAVNAIYEKRLDMNEQQAAAYGMDLATMLGSFGMTMEQFETDQREASMQEYQQNEVVKAIAEKEKVTVTDADLNALAVDNNYESKEKMIELLGEDVVNIYILTEKVVTLVVDNAVEI